ncbi:MAG TPA: hypothetical protein VEZ89_03045 [Rubrivivax sp.]|nr:hypothetical protein [Rubrivivax sp.]
MQLGSPALLVVDAGHRAGGRMRHHGAYDCVEQAAYFAVLARFLIARGVIYARDLPATSLSVNAGEGQRLVVVTAAVTVAPRPAPRPAQNSQTVSWRPRQAP